MTSKNDSRQMQLTDLPLVVFQAIIEELVLFEGDAKGLPGQIS